MPKLHRPSLLFHRPSGQARVRVDGCDHYLGKFGSPEAQARYDLHVSDWLRNKSVDRSTMSVDELALRFLEHAESYYQRDGSPSGEAYNIRVALRPLVRLFGQALVGEFGPLKLKAVRDAMISAQWKRTSINRNVRRIKAAFRWGVENEIVPPDVYHALQAVRGLSGGRQAAVESKPVLPVPRAFVEAIRLYVSRHVWSMIELQLLTGARPGEIVSMRVGDINTGARVWEYSPSTHKSQYRGRGRVKTVSLNLAEFEQFWVDGLELLAQTNPALILWPEAVVFLILQGYMFVHTVAMGLDEPVDRIGMGTTAECARFFGHSR